MASPWGQLALPTSSAPLNAAEWSELKAPGPFPLMADADNQMVGVTTTIARQT